MFDLSILTYFTQAGLWVKLVMLILVFASVLSWTYIIQRTLLFFQINRAMGEFIDRFWTGIDLQVLYSESNLDPKQKHGIAVLFRAGFKELKRCHKHGETDIKDHVERALALAQSEELDNLDKHLSFLASVGSISPYVGLFGTVCGIMTVLQTMGSTQQTGIAAIAPGISEALVATAMGLLAAIPAYFAYNRFVTQIKAIEQQFNHFTTQLLPLLLRQGV